MELHLHDLIDEQKCYEEVRQMCWPGGVRCPNCHAKLVNKRGFHTHQAHRQRYHCQACAKQFDDLTGTIFEDHLRLALCSIGFISKEETTNKMGRIAGSTG